MDIQILEETRSKLNTISHLSFNRNVFVGIDGYIDHMQRAVKIEDNEDPSFFETLEDFEELVKDTAGKSVQIELITQETKLGGSAPIMVNAIGCLGFPTTCIGNFGKNALHTVFENINHNVKLLSIGNPASTNALEFVAGKLILSEVAPFTKQNWEYVRDSAGHDKLINAINCASLIALVDWCSLPFSTDYWKGILDDVLPKITEKERYFFFDIADPSRRTDEELVETFDVLDEFNAYGKVTLGLNENETEKVYTALNRNDSIQQDDSITIIENGQFIFRNIHVSNLLIHPTDRAISINTDGVSELSGRVFVQPKISTSGGDNFNTGYCSGQLIGLDNESSLITCTANSGSYVQNGKSSSFQDVKDYILQWIKEIK